jgi:hypothetical protein
MVHNCQKTIVFPSLNWKKVLTKFDFVMLFFVYIHTASTVLN